MMNLGYFKYIDLSHKIEVEEIMKSNNVNEIVSEPEGRSNKLFNATLGKLKENDTFIINQLSDAGTLIRFQKAYTKLQKNGINIQILDNEFPLQEVLRLAEVQSRGCSVRSQKGYKAKIEKGETWGIQAYGYRTTGSTLEPDPKQWDIARFSVDSFLRIKKLRETRTCVFNKYPQKEWSINGLRGWLINPALRGHSKYGDGTIKHNTHTPLITPEESEQIFKTLEEGRKKGAKKLATNIKKDTYYALQGLIYCSCCGSSCFLKTSHSVKDGSTTEWMRCRRRDSGSPTCDNKKSARLRDIEYQVIKKLVSRSNEASQENQLQSYLSESEIKKELDKIQSEEIAAWSQQIDLLKKALLIQENLEIAALIADLERKVKEERNKLLYHFDANSEAFKKLINSQLSNINYWLSISEQERGELFKTFIKKVFVYNGELYDIEFKI